MSIFPCFNYLLFTAELLSYQQQVVVKLLALPACNFEIQVIVYLNDRKQYFFSVAKSYGCAAQVFDPSLTMPTFF